MGAHIPVIATGAAYAAYLDAARLNLTNMLRLSQALRDAEFELEAQTILDVFNDTAAEAEAIIAESEANHAAFDEDGFWRQSMHAEFAGMGEAA